MTDIVKELQEISERINHLENSAEWITKETIHQDCSVSQTATLISVLADEVRERVCQLVREIEKKNELYSKIN